ncbi:hypothetical protein WMY93_003378 [Mugilogobius chulae]|uniref:G-protein coupled receptors family 1 profile domain-containing protein n=1 Tax=Mugilogobius chulae TaxID=88201 RepID=A0AAW0PZP0_9GOBI
METTTEEEFCFPHLNSSCRRPSAHTQSQAAVIYTLLSLTALITTVLNLLVIIAIAHFRHRTKLDIQKQVFSVQWQLHSSTNFILLSLAVSTSLWGLWSFPSRATCPEPAGPWVTSCASSIM